MSDEKLSNEFKKWYRKYFDEVICTEWCEGDIENPPEDLVIGWNEGRRELAEKIGKLFPDCKKCEYFSDLAHCEDSNCSVNNKYLNKIRQELVNEGDAK